MMVRSCSSGSGSVEDGMVLAGNDQFFLQASGKKGKKKYRKKLSCRNEYCDAKTLGLWWGLCRSCYWIREQTGALRTGENTWESRKGIEVKL